MSRSGLRTLSLLTLCLCCALVGSTSGQQLAAQASVLVYAATPSGIMAAIEAAHLGKSVILLEPSQHVGGMTSSGLGQTDSYDLRALGGLVQTFFQTVHAIDVAAGNPSDVQGLHYEPHVAEAAFLQMLGQYPNIQIVYGESLASVVMNGTVIQSIAMTDGKSYSGSEFIDASYAGDLMAMAGVSYAVGRESVAQYGETLAGVQVPALWDSISSSPYVVPGDPSSGLIAHVTPNTLGPPGSADNGIMAYNYRLCLSSDPQNQIPFTAPAGYNGEEFELQARNIAGVEATGKTVSLGFLCSLYTLPNNKFDLNVCTDDVGASVGYPTGASASRQQIADSVREFDQGLLYFLLTDPRIPAAVQTSLHGLGLCKDEFTDNGGWPRQLYVREADRMVGQYVLTQADAMAQTSVPDPIGLGGFQFDMHDVNQVADPAGVLTEGGIEQPLTETYPISYRILTPLPAQATNLLVPVAVSASHVGYSSLRIEPTFMVMGQAAGAAASLAIDETATVQGVYYSALSATLISDGQVLSSSCCSGPAAFLSQTSLAFGPEAVGKTSASQSFTLSNNGAAPLTIASIAVTGAHGSSFAFVNSCGTSLARNVNCSFHGHFTPTIGGVLNAAIVITDNAGNSPQTVSLTGTGIGPAPGVKLSATSLSFASEVPGTSSPKQTATLTNTGNEALTIGAIQVTGTEASSFAVSNNCGPSLAAGSSCSIQGDFTPTAGGVLKAAIAISDNFSDLPQTIALKGIGLAPAVSLSTTSLSFGNVGEGTQSASQSVTLTNTGATTLIIGGIQVTGADASSFVFSNNCGSSLLAGSSCLIHGHFAPAAVGTFTATIALTDSVGLAPQTIALTGAGVTPDFSLSLTPASLAVNNGTSGTTTVGVASIGGFNQSVSLSCSGLPAGTSCSFSPSSVTAGSSPVTAVLTIAASSSAKSTNPLRSPLFPVPLLALVFIGFGFRKRSPSGFTLSILMGSLVLLLLGACGGGGAKNTPPTTALVTVQATSGSLSHSATLTLTVN